MMASSLAAIAASSGCRSGTAAATQRSDPCLLVSSDDGPQGLSPAKAEIVARGLEVPWAIAFLPSGNLLVTERPGRIRVVRPNGELGAPVADLTTVTRGEGGVLGLALHPNYAANRWFYVYRTLVEPSGSTNRVERYRLAEDEGRATFDRVIVDGIAGAAVHDGGRLHFGPDGMLYIGTGDGQKPDRAQDLGSKNGKLLRVGPEGEIPADNPFPNSSVYLYGLRNPQGFDWSSSGALWITDHGPSGELGRSGHDELNLAAPGDNLGWPTIFGCEQRKAMVTPKLTWARAVPPGGAAFYTGTAISEWQGSLLIGTLGSKHLHRVAFAPDEPSRIVAHEVYFKGDPPTGFGRLREVIMGPDHELYVTTSNCDGRGTCPVDKDKILRITRP
jgi:glucose/arabinose dehydrogenase